MKFRFRDGRHELLCPAVMFVFWARFKLSTSTVCIRNDDSKKFTVDTT